MSMLMRDYDQSEIYGTQRALLNILEDLTAEQSDFEAGQRALLNILDDAEFEKANLQGAQRAVLNILEDSEAEKMNLQGAQKAVLNILEDFDLEKLKVTEMNRELQEEIKERQRAQEEIAELNQGLEERVVERTAELTAANKELEAFTYSVSHDLRAPLRHISGFSKILIEEFGPSLPPEAQHHLQRIQQGTTRMGQLVDDLLNLARVGRREVSLQVTGLESLAQEVILTLEPDCAGREVAWRVGKLPFVECDTALVRQVFQNLLSNALKFTRPRAQAIIEVGQLAGHGAPIVFVRDNGVGFSMKYADKLFGVFQRLHRAEDFEGTGVGLATVHRIIHKHGGRIWAEAELDKGASFYFTLGESETKQFQPEGALIGAEP